MTKRYASGPSLEDKPEKLGQMDLNRARLLDQCGYTHYHIGGQKIVIKHLIAVAELNMGMNQ